MFSRTVSVKWKDSRVGTYKRRTVRYASVRKTTGNDDPRAVRYLYSRPLALHQTIRLIVLFVLFLFILILFSLMLVFIVSTPYLDIVQSLSQQKDKENYPILRRTFQSTSIRPLATLDYRHVRYGQEWLGVHARADQLQFPAL